MGKPKPPLPEAYDKPKGWPGCCDRYIQLYETVTTGHMVLTDLDEDKLILPQETGLLHFGYGSTRRVELDERVVQVLKIYVETMQTLHPLGRKVRPERIVDDEKVSVELATTGKKYAGVRVGEVDLINVHLTWAKRMLGGAPDLLYVAPALPVLLELDGELRGFVLGCQPQPPQLRMNIHGPGIE